MYRILSGTPVSIRWNVFTNGCLAPLSSRRLSAFVVVPNGRRISLDFDVVGSSLCSTLEGSALSTGIYGLLLYENRGTYGEAVDYIERAFVIVDHPREVNNPFPDKPLRFMSNLAVLPEYLPDFDTSSSEESAKPAEPSANASTLPCLDVEVSFDIIDYAFNGESANQFVQLFSYEELGVDEQLRERILSQSIDFTIRANIAPLMSAIAEADYPECILFVRPVAYFAKPLADEMVDPPVLDAARPQIGETLKLCIGMVSLGSTNFSVYIILGEQAVFATVFF